MQKPEYIFVDKAILFKYQTNTDDKYLYIFDDYENKIQWILPVDIGKQLWENKTKNNEG